MRMNIVTCFESNEERVTFIMETCLLRGISVNVYTTSFSHINKKERRTIPYGFTAIDTKPYKGNLSIGRLISHKDFAKKAFEEIEKNEPNLIWVVAPCHSLIKEANKYKQKHQEVKIIIDVIDMWPESLPIGFIKHTLPFRIWKSIRTNNIKCADYVVTECDMYQRILKKEFNGDIFTLPWCKNIISMKQPTNLPENKLSLVYLGSINNIVDIEQIKRLIENSDKKVILHVIGLGENKEKFIKELSKVCEVIDHGAVYDELGKAKIFSMCHAGLNIYKPNLFIGLTVKCIDYFMYGLPIINNIQGDTYRLVDEKKVGINVVKASLLNYDLLNYMRLHNENIYAVYKENFTKEIFKEKCGKIIDKVLAK